MAVFYMYRFSFCTIKYLYFVKYILLGCHGARYKIHFYCLVVEAGFTCSSWESNPGRWIYRQTLYHVAVKAGFYRKAVEVCYIPIPTTYFTALN